MTTFSPPSSPTAERQLSKAQARRKVLAEIDSAEFTSVPFHMEPRTKLTKTCFPFYVITGNFMFEVRNAL